MHSERPTLHGHSLTRTFGTGSVATVALHEVSLELFSVEEEELGDALAEKQLDGALSVKGRERLPVTFHVDL